MPPKPGARLPSLATSSNNNNDNQYLRRMQKIPSIFYKVKTQVVFFLAVPLFFLSFALLYRPTWMLTLFGVGSIGYAFNVTIITTILMAVMSLSRMMIFILRRRLNLNWLQYMLWSAAEIVVEALFVGLYVWLMSHQSYAYFSAAGYSFVSLLSVVCYPLVVFSLVYERYAVAESAEPLPEQLIRFHDTEGRLRAVIASNSVLYLEAKENYVKICYAEGQNVKEYLLHSSMKALEQLLQRYGIVRCQRSYFINPKHVTVLKREKDGMIVALLDIDSLPKIPVSPKYYDILSSLL